MANGAGSVAAGVRVGGKLVGKPVVKAGVKVVASVAEQDPSPQPSPLSTGAREQENTITQPVEQLSTQPSEQPVEQPSTQASEQPVEQPSTQASEQPVEQPSEQDLSDLVAAVDSAGRYEVPVAWVSVRIPVGDLPAGYEQTLAARGAVNVTGTHLQLQMKPELAGLLLRVRQALRDLNESIDESGKPVVSNADVIRWLLLQVAAGLEVEAARG